MKKIAIFGAGGHGKVAASIAEEVGLKVSFFDDSFPNVTICGVWPVRGNKSDLIANKNSYDFVFVAIGSNRVRYLIQQEFDSLGLNITNLVSPTASVHKSVKLGRGILIVSNACINIDSNIEDGCIVNSGATVDHDCRIKSFSHISPGVSLAGGVIVGKNSWVGIGSSVIQQISIGSNTIVGAGTTVISNVPDKVTFVGCPGHIIKRL